MNIHRDHLPPDWEACTHPEGRLYFYHAAKVCSRNISWTLLTTHNSQRIYTDCDVRNPKILKTLDTFSKEIDDRISEQSLVLPVQRELVLFLEERKVSGGYNWCYYFVDHETRTLFWIQECNPISDLEILEITALKGPYDISMYTPVFKFLFTLTICRA